MNYKLLKLDDNVLQIHHSVFLADGVVIAGDVSIEEGSNIWFNSIIRGDVAPVIIGKNTNIQDGTVIHTSLENGGTYIGNNITIGHMALLHACNIESNAFIGMKSMIMDNVVVEEFGFVAAGSVVSPRKIIKKRELWMGNPAKYVRMINDTELTFMSNNIKNYINLSNKYKSLNHYCSERK